MEKKRKLKVLEIGHLSDNEQKEIVGGGYCPAYVSCSEQTYVSCNEHEYTTCATQSVAGYVTDGTGYTNCGMGWSYHDSGGTKCGINHSYRGNGGDVH